ncbi:exocyst subunit, partial [Spiromyces aspiralis]
MSLTVCAASLPREQFNPVALALQMSDSSSIGLDYNVFKRYHQALNTSLEDIINEYYTSFNTSILSFSGLHDRINSASTTIGQTRSDLITVKQLLTEERGSVEQLYTKSKQAEETLSIIDKIIEVRNLPQEVRQLVEEKKFTEASKKLAQGLQFVSNPEFRPIKTLYVLEQKLNGEKENAVKVIIEELHNHVYLKSPYSERKFTLEEGSDDDEEAIKKIRVGAYAKKKDAKTPESDSFSYVGQLLECLSTLNMGTVVTATVVERAPKEISELVDRIITEVEDRAQNLIDQATWQSPDSLEEAASEALDDFFRVLFSGFESVLDYHFHISRMIEKINAEASGPPGSDPAQVNSVKPYDVGLIWAAMKQEIAVLLKNYLIPAGNALASGTAGADKDGRPQHTLFEISLDTESHEIAVQLYDDILTKMGNLDLADGAKSLAPEASQAP